ncbi:MAG: FkbM family methyltransferase [Candidatus Micrarchaeales archaeon]
MAIKPPTLSKEWLDKKIAEETDALTKHGLKPEIRKDEILLNYKGTELSFVIRDKIQLFHAMLMLDENLGQDQYSMMTVKDKVVVDIGAYYGESAILFALKGSPRIVAYELYPYSAKIAQENVRRNNLQDVITIVNKGCGIPSSVRIPLNHRNMMFSALKDFKRGKKVDVLSLQNIVETNRIPLDSRIKFDCEGCENDAILKSTIDIMGRFKQVFMEYHYGYRRLTNKLGKMLFNVKYGTPRLFKNSATGTNMHMGLLFAEFVPEYKEILVPEDTKQ